MVCVEREMGFEPTTLCLEGRCSTPELLPPGVIHSSDAAARGQCERIALADNAYAP